MQCVVFTMRVLPLVLLIYEIKSHRSGGLRRAGRTAATRLPSRERGCTGCLERFCAPPSLALSTDTLPGTTKTNRILQNLQTQWCVFVNELPTNNVNVLLSNALRIVEFNKTRKLSSKTKPDYK